MEYALIAVVIIVVLISSSIVLYFATSTTSTTSATTTTSTTTSNGTKNTEKVLNKFYTNKETFSGETDKEKEIWNEVKALAPPGTFEFCDGPIPERENIPAEFEKSHRKSNRARSANCYLAIQVKDNKVDDDQFIAMSMLTLLYQQDDIIAEFAKKGKTITIKDILSYDTNTKMVTPGEVLKDAFTPGVPISLTEFMKKQKNKMLKDMTPEVKVNPDGTREYQGLTQCDLCYKQTKLFEDVEGDKIEREIGEKKRLEMETVTKQETIQSNAMMNNMSTEMQMNNMSTGMQMNNMSTEMEMKKKQENFTMYF
jgi:hypothetical protein